MQLTVDHVVVSYSGRTVLRVAHAVFSAGRVGAIVGPSGSGKSTLLGVVSGLIKADSGSVSLGSSTEPGRFVGPPTRSDVAWVPQGAHLLAERSVIDNVMMGRLSDGSTLYEAFRSSEHALHQVGLEDLAKARASTLSGGEIQRVALARAISSDRPILIADEPTASLDRQSAAVVAQVLAQLVLTKIVLIATHDAAIVEVCDDVLNLGGA